MKLLLDRSTKKVNNDFYRHLGHAWWDDNVGEYCTIRFYMNPVRFNYFLKPTELCSIFEHHGLDHKDMRGITPARPGLISLWLNFRRRAQGKITFKELGRRLAFKETGYLNGSYMGYAVKGKKG